MPKKIFYPLPAEDEIKQFLAERLSTGEGTNQIVNECMARFPSAGRYGGAVSRETVLRYLKDIKTGNTGDAAKPAPTKKTAPTVIVAPGVSKDAFTPLGAPTIAPAGSPTPEYLTIGTFRMPMEDWGYSSAKNLLVVAATFDQAKREYNFDSKMKVGDFLAQLCQAFRMMRGWDVIGVGYTKKGEENRHDDSEFRRAVS